MIAMAVKGITDFTFGGAFLWYLVKFIVYGLVPFGGIRLGIFLRKKKNAKAGLQIAKTETVSEE